MFFECRRFVEITIRFSGGRSVVVSGETGLEVFIVVGGEGKFFIGWGFFGVGSV